MKNTLSKIGVALLSLNFLSACAVENTVKTINSAEAYQMMSEENSTILDVRTAQEYNEGHIKNAINIPLDKIKNELGKLNKDEVILIYCRSGNRSKSAAQLLAKQGFKHIYDFGGLNTWEYEIVK